MNILLSSVPRGGRRNQSVSDAGSKEIRCLENLKSVIKLTKKLLFINTTCWQFYTSSVIQGEQNRSLHAHPF